MTTYSVRIKAGSPIDLLITWLNKHPNATRLECRKAGFAPRAIQTVFAMTKWTENYTWGKYVEVAPQNIIQHAEIKGKGGAPAPMEVAEPLPENSVIRFPEAPPLLDRDSRFRKPSWYGMMKKMVLECGKHVAVSGPPGIGKSTAIEQLAAETHHTLVSISADGGLRRRDLTGSVELAGGRTVFMAAEYVTAAVMGWWVKIDEVNAADADTLLFLNSQIATPYRVNFYGKSAPVHPDFRLFVTFNPGLVGTKPLPDSFRDRFLPIKLAFPGDAELKKILTLHGMAHIDGVEDAYMDIIVKAGRAIWQAHERGRCRYQVTPRRLMDAVLLLQQGMRDPYKALEFAILGHIDNPAECKAIEMSLSEVRSGSVQLNLTEEALNED